MIRKIIFSLSILSCSVNITTGQDKSHFSLSTNIFVSELIKHNPDIDINANPPLSKGIDINFNKDLLGKKSWHHSFNYPKSGISFSYCNLDNNELFGKAISIMPNVTIPILRLEKWENTIEFGWGMAYLTKKYDHLTNPNNNIIGSHINALVSFRYKLHYKIQEKHQVNLGFDFKHYSNGGSFHPNLGINLGGLTLGYTYIPSPVEKEDIQDFVTKDKKRWQYTVSTYIAHTELEARDNSRRPIYIGQIAATLSLGKIHELSSGLDYEFKKAIYQKLLNDNQSTAFAKRKATRLGVSLNYEILLGDIGINFKLGTYLLGLNYDTIFPVYTKIGMNYYLPLPSKIIFYLSSSVKTHTGVAEYFSFGLGCKF